MKKSLFKLLISVTILLVLAYSASLESLKTILHSISYEPILYALFWILAIRFIMALRWQLLLGHYDIHIPFTRIVGIIFVSNAVGHLLPSGIGTDIIRTVTLSQNEGQGEKVLASVFLDRVFGLASMLLVALVASWYASLSGLLTFYIPIAGSLLVMILASFFLISPFRLSQTINLTTNIKLLTRLFGFYNKFLLALRQTAIPVRGLCVLVTLSVAVQFIRSISFMFIFVGLGSDLAVIHYFVFVPVVFIAMLIPISIGGLGVRESALFAFFGPLGQSLATCTLAGLISHLLQLVMIIPGLVLFNLKK